MLVVKIWFISEPHFNRLYIESFFKLKHSTQIVDKFEMCIEKFQTKELVRDGNRSG